MFMKLQHCLTASYIPSNYKLSKQVFHMHLTSHQIVLLVHINMSNQLWCCYRFSYHKIQLFNESDQAVEQWFFPQFPKAETNDNKNTNTKKTDDDLLSAFHCKEKKFRMVLWTFVFLYLHMTITWLVLWFMTHYAYPYLSMICLSLNPLGSTISSLWRHTPLYMLLTPMLTDTCTYPQHATLSPLDSYHSAILISFLTFLLDNISYLS